MAAPQSSSTTISFSIGYDFLQKLVGD